MSDELRDYLDEIMAQASVARCRVEGLEQIVLDALEQSDIRPADGKTWHQSLHDYQDGHLDILLRTLADEAPRLASAVRRIIDR